MTTRQNIGLFAFAFCLAAPTFAWAAPVSFDLGANNSPEVVVGGGTNSRWDIGTGWGTDASEVPASSPTLLGGTFDVRDTLPSEAFVLSAGGSHVFDFGTITLTEPNTGGGILAAETDGLGVIAHLFFDLPPGVSGVSNGGIVVPVAGAVSDAGGDLSIFFLPVLVDFGNGGQFSIDLLDVIFTNTGQTHTITATVTLLAEEIAVVVPEPSTLALAGMGLASLLGYGVRRRKLARG